MEKNLQLEVGSSKKNAEMHAAKEALEIIEKKG